MGWVARLTGRQLVHRPTSWALLALGVAVTSAIPVVAHATAQVVTAQTIRQTVQQLSPGQRSITVIYQPSTIQPVTAADDSFIRSQLGYLSPLSTRRQLLYRPLTVKGTSFYLTGTDRIESVVRLTGGRWPASCTATRCEVLALGNGSTAALTVAGATIGVVVVGTAARTDPGLASGTFDTGPTPLLLSGNVDALFGLRALELFGRTYGWIKPMDADTIVRSGVSSYLGRFGRVNDAITTRVAGTGVVSFNDRLVAQDERARLSASRFGLLGGTGAVLLLGFALVATIGLRREHRVLLALLRRRGARRMQLLWLSSLRAGTCCAVGGLIGVGIGAALAGVLASGAGLRAGNVVADSVSASASSVAVLVVAAIALVVAALAWPESGARSVWRTVDGVAVACAAILVVSYERGNTPASATAVGADPLVVILPVLAAVIGGLAAARLLLPLTTVFGRLLVRSASGRIAVLGALRRPLRPAATVGFITAAVASVVFAGAYRSTLLAAAQDQAAYQVPLDVRLTTGTDLTSPLQATSAQAIAAKVPGARTFPVLRSNGLIRAADGSSSAVTLLGIDPRALPAVNRFSRTFGTTMSRDALAGAISSSAVPRGPMIPAGTRRLQMTVPGADTNIEIDVAVATAEGFESGFMLSGAGSTLTGTVPALGSGPLFVRAVSINESPDYSTHHTHAVGEGSTDQPLLTGTVQFAQVAADGRALSWDWSVFTSRLGTATASKAGLRLGFRLRGSAVVALAGPQLSKIAVAVDPVTARSADNGRLKLLVDQRVIEAHVVAVLARVPTASGKVVLGDVSALRSVIDATTPPTGSVRELWLAAPPAQRAALDAAVRSAPFDRLTVSSRATAAHRISADPIGRGASRLLITVAGSALVAVVVALILLVIGELGDGSAELFAWEADGVRPATLRRTVFVRAVVVIGVALPVGLLTGLALAAAATGLIAVDGTGIAPTPPLQTSIGPLWSLAVLGSAFAVAVAVVGAVSARSLREALPTRSQAWSGE